MGYRFPKSDRYSKVSRDGSRDARSVVLAHPESEVTVRMVLIFAALAGLAYVGFKYVIQGAPQPRMTNIVTLPGAAVSKLTFHGGNLGMVAMVIGGAVIVLLIAYAVMSSNK
jgi:hypothetical protein